ncbi:MAG TPA: NAD(P)H-hydrate dehydratase [Bacteroidales bacterium]|nr:NAD(P)H-hydrate dehydratase [Bacteroidales bacterium]
MKIFTGDQIRFIDRYTIENEPVRSIDLMERAAARVFEWIVKRYPRDRCFLIFAGPGNNGGDGLAVARLLANAGFPARVFCLKLNSEGSGDWKINRQRLGQYEKVTVTDIAGLPDMPSFSPGDIIIDAIFGSGLSRSVTGLAASVIGEINNSGCEVISVDVPSGLPCENPGDTANSAVIRASFTLTFQFPKLSFMFPESNFFTGEWHILPIGLSQDAIRSAENEYELTCISDVSGLLRKRKKFDHKGVYGHGLLVAGSRDKAGAAVLSSRAALRSGIGLLTCHLPYSCAPVVQTAVPEAMIQCDPGEEITESAALTGNYSAIAAGPGLGTAPQTCRAVIKLIESSKKPLVIDADALNILSLQKDWPGRLKPGTILTPHPGEFERLAGKTPGGFERMLIQKSLSVKHNLVIVLKGAYTSVSSPEGKIYFNSNGNPGMATAGSGDVLTGIILSLLAQGYVPLSAARLGVFIHGLAGDIAAERFTQESLIASDITDNLGDAFKKIKEAGINLK